MDIKHREQYESLTNGGEVKLTLTQAEACVALYIHDYGVEYLGNDDKQTLYTLIGKLKDQIWP